MRPKTRFEYKVVEANCLLPQLAKDPIDWAFKTTMKHYAYRTKSGRTSCMDCGYQWTTTSKRETCLCPKCRAKLKLVDTQRRTETQKSYFSVATTQNEFQVQRIFLLSASFKKGRAARTNVVEVARYWINEQGKLAVTGLRRTLGYYMDSFDYSSNLDLRSDNEVYRQIAETDIYPKGQLLPILKRNGLKKIYSDCSFIKLTQSIITDSRIETIAKTRKASELCYFINHKLDLDFCWSSLKVAIRHNYAIEDISLWADYIRLLVQCSKDIHNAFYVCPDNLKEAHDRYQRLAERIREKKRKEEQRLKAIENDARFRELKEKFFGLSFSNGKIVVSVLDSIQAYYDEGTELHHCVGQCEYFLRPYSLVFSARIDGLRIETVELSLETFKVLQSRGLCNKSTEYHDEIINLVQSNISQVKKRMTA